MTAISNILLIAGLVIGLVFGAVALLSGFCLASGLRNWWTEGDSRLIRSLCAGAGGGNRGHANAGRRRAR